MILSVLLVLAAVGVFAIASWRYCRTRANSGKRWRDAQAVGIPIIVSLAAFISAEEQRGVFEGQLRVMQGQAAYVARYDESGDIIIKQIAGEFFIPSSMILTPYLQSSAADPFVEGKPVAIEPARYIKGPSGGEYFSFPNADKFLCENQMPRCEESAISQVIVRFQRYDAWITLPVQDK